MCGGTAGSILNRVGLAPGSGDAGTIGQPDTAKTPIGDTGQPAMVAQKRKPRSLLSGAATGDMSSGGVAATGAKATLGA